MVKHGRGSVMLWSYLTAKRVDNSYKTEQPLNLKLLQEELYTTLIDFDFDLDEVNFQQDNASIRKAKIV
jgi:hypothetical protein